PNSAMDLAEQYDLALARANGELAPLADEPDQAAAAAAPVLAPTLLYDPQTVMHRMEAWMPDAIASYKLKGFVHDFRGEVVESVPGKIRVHLGNGNGMRGSGSWFRLRKKTDFVDMELRMDGNHP